MLLLRPQTLRILPLWAYVSGNASIGSAAEIMDPSGGEGLSAVRFDGGASSFLVQGGPDGSAAVDGTAAAAAYLGDYNGAPAWMLGEGSGALYLFLSRNAGGHWVLFGECREPFAWTVDVVQADGSVETTAYGDTWHQGSLPGAVGSDAAFACAGAAALQAEADGDPEPASKALRAVATAWRHVHTGFGAFRWTGEYSAYCGGATGTRRLGFWSWSLSGAVFAMDPADTEELRRPDGSRLACPGSVWTVASDSAGDWTCDLSSAAYGQPLLASWALRDGAGDDGAEREDIAIPWNGLATLRADSGDEPGRDYVFQASRLL